MVGSFGYWQAGEQPPVPPDHVDSGSFSYWQAGEQPPVRSGSAVVAPEIDLSASGVSASLGMAALNHDMSISATAAPASGGSADLTLVTALTVTQTGLQVDVSAGTHRVTQVTLQAEGSTDKLQVTQALLQVDAKTQVLRQVTQASLQAEAASPVLRTSQFGLQVEARSRRPATAVNCWEFHVADRVGNYLAYLDGAYEKAYLAQLNEMGSGSFKIHALDPKATQTNLAIGNIVLVRYHNVDIGAFVIEEVVEEIVSEREEEGHVFTVSGRGLFRLLDDCIIYPEGGVGGANAERQFVDRTKASILLDLYDEFVARGGGCIETDFTATHDSDGQAWTDTVSLSFRVGQSLFEVAKHLAALGMDLTISPNRLLSARPTAGQDRRDRVFFRHGQNMVRCLRRRQGGDLTNVVIGEGQAGVVESTDDASIVQYGRHETYLSVRNTDSQSQVEQATGLLLEQFSDPVDALEVVVSSSEFYPFLDYDLGDIVTIDVPGKIVGAYRVLGISVRERQGPCDLEVTLELNSLAYDYLVRLSRSLEASQTLSSGAGSAAGLADGHPHSEGDITDIVHDAVKIQGRAVDPSAPANGDALRWNQASARWSPGRPAQLISFTFYVPGALAVGSVPIRLHAYSSSGTIQNVSATVGASPSGSSVIVDVNKNGTSIFTTQANRPTIPPGSQDDLSSVPDITGFAMNDVFTIDIDQVGSVSPGADLVVQVQCLV